MFRFHADRTSFCRLPLEVPGELYVSPMPYGRYDSERVFRRYRQQQIQRVVVLLSDREIRKRCRRDLLKLYRKHHMEVTQFPMVDFLQPGHGDMDQLIPDLARRLRAGERMVIHCHAGVGRSSVVAACLVAVLKQLRIEECIEYLRTHMETNLTVEQQRFIAGWIERLHESAPDAPLVLRSAELVTTGSELLQGRTLNLHGFRLGGLLTSFGIPLQRESVLADNQEAITQAVLEAVSRSDLVVVTGGLGPTDDDLTLEAVGRALRREVIRDPRADEHLELFFVHLRRTPTPNQRRQSRVLAGAEVYLNPAGIAPGQRLTLSKSRHLWLLPGPPRELNALLECAVRPWLETAITRRDHHQRIFRLVDTSESEVQEAVHRMRNFREVDVAYCATPGSVELRFTGTGERVEELAAQTRRAFADRLLNENGDLVEVELSRLLRERGQTLALAESCTAGGVAERISSVAGASDYLLGGVVAYANAVKVHELGVDPELLAREGAVSAAVAEAMARGLRRRFAADWCVSITGIAGPGGGSPEKPVGLFFVGVSGPAGERSRRFQVGGDRGQVREQGIQRAMIELWKALSAGS